MKRITFSARVLLGLGLGIAVGLFFGDAVAPLAIVAAAYIRLLQMTVLPYVVLSIIISLGSLSYEDARRLGVRAGAVLVVIWVAALLFACLLPLALPSVESAAFFSPTMTEHPAPFNFVDLYIPSNPFHSLANNVVPAVVLFSVFVGLALIGVEKKPSVLDVLDGAAAAVRRIARFVVGLTPFGIFAISGHTAGTIDVASVQRIEVFLIAYVAFALILALWVLPGLVAAFTPIGARETLSASSDALITAFVVGDLFIVLPSLMDSCAVLIKRRLDPDGPTSEIPSSIVPMSFTFPHAGKLLSLSFILFAGWFSDSAIPLFEYPRLVLSGFFAFFGSLNAAVPFLLDLFRIPADTFELFLATNVVNARFGTLVAATHTLAVGLLGSAAIAGKLQWQPKRLIRFAVTTVVLTAATIIGLRVGFATYLLTPVDGRALVNSLEPLVTPAVDAGLVIQPADVADDSIPREDHVLADIRARGVLRVGLIADVIPYQYRNDRSQVVGFDIEMAQSLAADLGVGVQFVRFPFDELSAQVHARRVDIVMAGARLTPNRAADFATSEPYVEETLAIVTPDHRRGEFHSWQAIHDMGTVRLGVQNLPYYVNAIRRLLPEAELSVIPDTRELIDPNAPYDAYVLPAERGSVLTMLNPRFSVVVPEGATIRMPLAYPLAGHDPSWIRFVNTWIGLKKGEGLVDSLYAHWIMGRGAKRKPPRWSIIRNVLHWVD